SLACCARLVVAIFCSPEIICGKRLRGSKRSFTSMNAKRIITLRESVARFEEVVASFERVRADILQRRRGAADHVMVVLDERLDVNARTLKSLKQSLELAR